MNALEKKLFQLDPSLFVKLEETKKEIELLLDKFSTNFPTYTDHSINHTSEVFKIASEILSDDEIELLNADDLYILSMSCLLHDVGMCIPEDKIKDIAGSEDIISHKTTNTDRTVEDYIRDIHHTLSNRFIVDEWELLKIQSKKYAIAIGLVAEGHRKVDIGNFEVYDPQFFAKSGKESVCLPYLASILRIADELDVTNSRTPKLLTKYYMPNNEVSIREWRKHIATSQRNILNNEVIFEVDCSDQKIYAALQDQFDKIQNVLNYCQKIIRSIPPVRKNHFKLQLAKVRIKYNFIGFDPKGIRFSFDVQNVVAAFIGEDLYKDKLTALREAIQNSIDSCRYKTSVLKDIYEPLIKVTINHNTIIIDDNAVGMDEFVIENFFGRLGSSFYEQEKIKTQFEAIGQFGVGVFSYFLLAEFIDIDTKVANGKALRFRFDKDPKSYFHFFDKAERTISGTTIILHLKSNLGTVINKDIEVYFKRTFKHVEIPIEVDVLGSRSLIKFTSFEPYDIKSIKDKLKLQHKRDISALNIHNFYINDEDIEGVCCFVTGKQISKFFFDYRDYFDRELFSTYDSRYPNSQFSFSQKGVFVNNYSTPNLYLVFGDINLKKKVKINIDRNGFTDEDQIRSYMQRFEVKILEYVFNLIEDQELNDEERLKITNDFLTNYINLERKSLLSNNAYLSLFGRHLFIATIIDGTVSIHNIDSLVKMSDHFILLLDDEDAKAVSKKSKMPVVVASGTVYDGVFYELEKIFTSSGYHESVLEIKSHSYLLLSKNSGGVSDEQFDVLDEIMDGLSFTVSNSKKLVVSIWKNKPEYKARYYEDELYFNTQHPFVKLILDNKEAILSNIEIKRIIKAAFYFIAELYSNDNIDSSTVSKINEIILPLEVFSNFRPLKKSDF